MKKLFIAIWASVFLFGMSGPAIAQQTITVTGTVTDAANGETLPGVSVMVKGTTTGTQTGVNGDFTIAAPPTGTIVFTYIGFQQREVPVNNQTTMTVQLQTSAQQLEQVVVVGYGAQRRRDVTGAVSNVQGSDLAKQPVQTPTQAMQGRVSGVQVISSGQPNAQPQVRIRGTGSTLGGVNPLYVVDGVLTDDIRNINTADIVSMDVLKDASAAIYGVRAANGVIIITTRKGRSGDTKVTYNANAGFRQAVNVVEMADRNQYIDYLSDASPGTQVDNPPLTFGGTTRWFDEILRNAFQMNHNLSVSGGSEKNTFFYSAGYITENGIIRTNDFSRFNFRANNEINISEKLKFGSQLTLSRANERGAGLGSTQNAYRASPIVPSIIDGRYGNTSRFGSVGNPLIDLDKRDAKIVNNRLQGNVALDYNPLSFLTFHTAFNADMVFSRDRTYSYQFGNDESIFLSPGGDQYLRNSALDIREDKSVRWIWDNTVTFDKRFDQHNLTVTAGTVTERFDSDFLRGRRIDVPATPDQWYLNVGNPEGATNENGGDRYTRQSFLGRVNYSYANKYLLTASLRADGSSRFKERWGYFPTVGLGWVLSEEDFMKDQELFNFLKLRGSWGILGNDNIASNLYIVTAGINIPYFYDNGISLGSVIQDIKDEDLQWEKTKQYDLGLEFALLNNRLRGEVDYYNKRTEDALTVVSIPGIFGDPDNAYTTNASTFRNSGFEFNLSWEDKIPDDFTYRIGGNITFNKNKVIGLNGGQALLGGGVGQQGFVTRTDNGTEVGSYYVLNAIGVFQDQQEINNSPVFGTRSDVRPGDLKYEDVSGPGGVPDGVIDNNDKIYAGSYQPKFYYGINLGFTYKNFDLTADFFGNAGNEIYNAKKAFRYQQTDNIEASFANARWKSDRPSGTDPRTLTSATPASTYFIEKGDFLRLNNLTVGYTLPADLLKRVKISNFRVFATAQNLFTITNYSGFSPEFLSGNPLEAGLELNTYPTTRTIAFGVNLGF